MRQRASRSFTGDIAAREDMSRLESHSISNFHQPQLREV